MVLNISDLQRRCFRASEWIDREYDDEPSIIERLIDVGDKFAIIGQSKNKKSFFALQLALSASTGSNFLGFNISRPFKTVLAQFEIKESKFHGRLHLMSRALDLTSNSHLNGLFTLNLRGSKDSNESICAYLASLGCELVIFDPLYKMLKGDENSAEDMKRLLALFDSLCEKGISVGFVHHDKKGIPSYRTNIDRGAGSGVLARDYDSAFVLTKHSSEDPDVVVVDTVSRNYKEPAAFAVKFENGAFWTSNEAPTRQRSTRGGSPINQKPDSEFFPLVKELLETHYCSTTNPLPIGNHVNIDEISLTTLLRKKGFPQKKTRSITNTLAENQDSVGIKIWATVRNKKWIKLCN